MQEYYVVVIVKTKESAQQLAYHLTDILINEWPDGISIDSVYIDILRSGITMIPSSKDV